MAEENAAFIARRWFYEVFNQRNLDVVPEIMASDHVYHDTENADFTSLATQEQTQAFLDRWLLPFPDAQITINAEIVQGDMVVHRWTAGGYYNGEPLAGTTPHGDQVTVVGITISRVSNAKVQETWNSFDALYLLYQIGYPLQPIRWPLW
jgi:predicted ester cyclase